MSASLLIPAENLSEGDTLLLPFGKTATIVGPVKVTRNFVSFRTEFGKTRLEVGHEVDVQARTA